MLGQAMGKSREQYVQEAQSKSKNAHAASVAAAFALFKSQLEEDQAAYEALKVRQGMNQIIRLTNCAFDTWFSPPSFGWPCCAPCRACKEDSKRRQDIRAKLEEMRLAC